MCFKQIHIVVSYPKSSSNHNIASIIPEYIKLYLILNHHQTTTIEARARMEQVLYLILNHHQTTTQYDDSQLFYRCILS